MVQDPQIVNLLFCLFSPKALYELRKEFYPVMALSTVSTERQELDKSCWEAEGRPEWQLSEHCRI